ncbi:MAG: endopeptidase La [bacterium]
MEKDKLSELPAELPRTLPAIAIRDVVMFPHMALPLSVDREKSVKALENAQKGPRLVLAVTQRQPQMDDPAPEDLFNAGVVSEISQSMKMPDGSMKVFLQGWARAKITKLRFDKADDCLMADVEYPSDTCEKTKEVVALMRQAIEAFESYLKLSRRIPLDAIAFLRQLEDPARLSDTIAANIVVRINDRQALQELFNPKERLEKLISTLNSEVEILDIEHKIHSRVRSQIEKNQKEYYLSEQMKAIQKELHQKDDFAREIDEFRKKIKQSGMTEEARKAAEKELARLEKMTPFSPETTVSRTYLDWLTGLPWKETTKDMLDIKKAHNILDEDHYGLEKPKERVLEYLAVRKLTQTLKGPILCFVGPPGVGKTSIARSIARAMGRKFVRMSLGGVRDEAEIRGHRRTYIASMPGRILQSMRKAKSANPVFLLDEIDKMGMDWRGDPAAALLEVLDPEQNREFVDHYLDVNFDISPVMFITTANTLDGIPASLRDRLEIIEFTGYTQDEKIIIARQFLLPRQLMEHGLKPASLKADDEALNNSIREYTREAGVRNLEREIANLCRRAAREIVENGAGEINVTRRNLHKYLGIPKFSGTRESRNGVGVATGLAWTEHGGEILSIEALSFKGKGGIMLTGKLGDVMKESAQAAFSYVKSRQLASDSWINSRDFHVHVPEGAVPKDGPSAGISIAAALASLFSGRPVKQGLSMTGELTLTGRILPIGGLKEKVLASYREGINTVLFPEGNRKDLEEISVQVRKKMKLVPIAHMNRVLELALESARPGRKFSRPANRRTFAVQAKP